MKNKKKDVKNKEIKTNKFISFVKSHVLLSILIGVGALLLIGGSSVFAYVMYKNSQKYCLVQFETNGGSPIDAQKIKCGSVATKPKIPVKDGFNFKYWEFDGKEYDFSIPVLENIVLNSIYEVKEGVEIVTVTFDTDGGSSVNSIQIQKGKSISPPINPTKKGYVFAGWYYLNEEFDFDFTINEDMTLIAKWNKEGTKSSENIKTQEQKTEDNKKKTSNAEIDKNLLGLWYYDKDPSVHIEISYTYILEKKAIDFMWDNIDLENRVLYPNYSHASGMWFYIPDDIESANDWLNNNQIKLSGSTLKIGKFVFTHTPKAIDYSEYDKYVGKWYLIGGDGQSFVEVTKNIEGYDASYFITVSDGSSTTQFPGEFIFQKDINEHNTVFDKYNIRLSNGYLTYEGKTYSKDKNVIVIHAKSFNINYSGNSNSIHVGETNRYSYKVYPENATDVAGTWSSSNTSVATVDQGGIVSGISIGSSQICYTNTNGVSGCLSINVNPVKVKGISFDKSSLSLYVGESEKINVTIKPSNATNQNYYWSTSDASVAAVNNDGTVNAYKKGTATITATTADGRYTATCTINVSNVPVSSISLDVSDLFLFRTNQRTLIATIAPENATNKKINWSTSDSNVATVDYNGKVTAQGKGTAVITAIAEDGNFSAACNITVENPELRASASYTKNSLTVGGQVISNNVGVQVNASGGTGVYRYSIKLYRYGTLVASSDNSESDSISYSADGTATYTAEYTVVDSDGNTVSGTLSPHSL